MPCVKNLWKNFNFRSKTFEKNSGRPRKCVCYSQGQTINAHLWEGDPITERRGNSQIDTINAGELKKGLSSCLGLWMFIHIFHYAPTVLNYPTHMGLLFIKMPSEQLQYHMQQRFVFLRQLLPFVWELWWALCRLPLGAWTEAMFGLGTHVRVKTTLHMLFWGGLTLPCGLAFDSLLPFLYCT